MSFDLHFLLIRKNSWGSSSWSLSPSAMDPIIDVTVPVMLGRLARVRRAIDLLSSCQVEFCLTPVPVVPPAVESATIDAVDGLSSLGELGRLTPGDRAP
jgi:hypothetical protein